MRGIAIGIKAAQIGPGTLDNISIGTEAKSSDEASTAIGYFAEAHGAGSVALGNKAVVSTGANYGVSVGSQITNDGVESIGIGQQIGIVEDNTIVINASGSGFTGSVGGAFYVKPIRGVIGATGLENLCYDPVNCEVVDNPKFNF